MRTAQISVVAGIAMAWAVPVFAGCDIPFRLNTGSSLNGAVSFQCTGPWGRASSCVTLTPNMVADQFYCSENTIFSNKGEWSCTVSTNSCSNFVQNVYVTDFCVTNDDPVDLTVTGASAPSVDKTLAPCGSTSTSAFLGHAPASQPPDRDTYVWRGKAGSPFVVKLERDETGGGSDGSRARIVVLAGGNSIGQDSGAMPLRVSGRIPASGELRIKVSEATGAGSKAFSGTYRLSVDADGLRKDRTLEPMDDVEP